VSDTWLGGSAGVFADGMYEPDLKKTRFSVDFPGSALTHVGRCPRTPKMNGAALPLIGARPTASSQHHLIPDHRDVF
jgi:hypothetical protein